MQPGRTAGLTERVVISVYVLASQLDKGTPTRSNWAFSPQIIPSNYNSQQKKFESPAIDISWDLAK